jgi:hypothetical protein
VELEAAAGAAVAAGASEPVRTDKVAVCWASV